ncbi:hybrid sensor histidine kinase/response regulator [Pseudomonas oryzihabitans]|uniref:hybrid sensor histidine kinase/response regulator n=1 Tax=Pseudomonas oryzihabitans TaxID=47885 RepID=UPI00285C673E|nr:response regulator [Pseudomonas psychrotolerans]MDR6678666.1 CheY-like chemotaxis protein/signal transduction histidine kinase [Pseudomonas psychrotolerans]
MHRLWIALGFVVTWLLLLLVTNSVQAESPLDAGWAQYEDATGEFRLDDVRDRLSAFKPLTTNKTHRPEGPGALWLHTRIQPSPQQRLLRIVSPNVAYLDFYAYSEAQLISEIRDGLARPLLTPQQISRDFVFPVPPSNETLDLFLRFESSQPMRISLTLSNSAEAEVTHRLVMFGVLLGCLAMLALYNGVQLFYYRSRATSALTLLLVMLVCVAMNLFGLSKFLLGAFKGQAPLLTDLSVLACSAAGLNLIGAFFGWLRLPVWTRRLIKGLLVLVGLAALVRIAAGDVYLGDWLMAVNALVLLACLAIAVERWHQGARYARLLMAAFALLGLSGLIALPILAGYANAPIWLGRALISSCMLSGILLTLALEERRRYLREEHFAKTRDHAANHAELKGKAEFLSRISHEIRTPMNGVLGMTELLQGTALSAKQRDYVQTIHSAGAELLNLINEIIDITRLESGQIELEEVTFDLNALLDDCLDIFRPRAEEHRVELLSFIQPQVPRRFIGDPTRLRQILLNLLENAFQRTEEGEILLVMSLEEATGQAPRLRIAVQDSGTPLDAALSRQLLSSHLNSRDFLSGDTDSLDFGLIIARQLVLLMQGEFGIQNNSEGGSSFWISLPIPAQALVLSRGDSDYPLQDVRVLVVDDNELCRKVLQQQCSAWGMQVVTAASGREALALLRTQSHLREYFDVVLLDQQMPGMTGMQLAARINEDENLNHDLLLIMLTGLSNAPSKVIARNAGIKRILAKPVAGYTLRATLADELSRRGQRTSEPEPQEQPSGIPADFRVLVAEDNSISVKVIRGMLKKLGVEPDTVSNGLEAFEKIQQNSYDLILMDCEMPLLDGFGATRRLRAWEQQNHRSRTPVVALTAHILAEHKDRAQEAGMDGHMGKPIELSQLRELLLYWAERRRLDVAAQGIKANP